MPAGPAFRFHRSTPGGEGGVGVFDLYGDGALSPLCRAFRPRGGELPGEGRSRIGDIVDLSGEIADEAVVSRIPAHGMWSRLPAWTISVHGGEWVQRKVEALLAALGGEVAGTRDILNLALAGGSMDAIEAAAFEALVGARTEMAARFLARQYAGELSSALRRGLDLAREGRAEESLGLIQGLLEHSRAARRLVTPLRVLIAGRPNAGKSTLFNRLVEDERAAVTPLPGTTRDVLEAWIAIRDYPVVIADSAGIRSPGEAGEIERLGIEMMKDRDDDAILFLLPHPWKWSPDDEEFVSAAGRERVLVAASLADIAGDSLHPGGTIRLSAVTGEGIDDVRDEIVRRWIDGRGGMADVPCAPFTAEQIRILSRPRCLDSLPSAYIECLRNSWPPPGT